MSKKRYMSDIIFIAIALSALIYLFFAHRNISDNILREYHNQQKEIEYLETVRDSLEEDNRYLEYRKLLLENDIELYYETLLREDHRIAFEDETVYILDDKDIVRNSLEEQ